MPGARTRGFGAAASGAGGPGRGPRGQDRQATLASSCERNGAIRAPYGAALATIPSGDYAYLGHVGRPLARRRNRRGDWRGPYGLSGAGLVTGARPRAGATYLPRSLGCAPPGRRAG